MYKIFINMLCAFVNSLHEAGGGNESLNWRQGNIYINVV